MEWPQNIIAQVSNRKNLDGVVLDLGTPVIFGLRDILQCWQSMVQIHHRPDHFIT